MRHRIAAARLVLAATLAVALTGAAAGCSGGAASAEEPERLILASTTSTQDSGLFDELIPAFEKEHPEYEVEVIAVGTGEALELGRRGDADVLLVHAKADEVEFVSRGFGTERRDVMYNDFVIAGPSSDPAGVGGSADAPKALSGIAAASAPFVSRGDNSGTHKKEMALWEIAGVDVETAGDWYMSVGQGMGDSLRLASEEAAYILSDRATFLANSGILTIGVLVEGDEALYNQYGVVTVSGAANPEGGQAFADWVVAASAQEIIEGFGVEEFGEPLFTPNAE